jgi:preprotein translocase subunit SecD
VRGFAFFLGLSALLDLLIAWMFTRPVVSMLGRSRFFTEARWVGVARGLAASPAG